MNANKVSRTGGVSNVGQVQSSEMRPVVSKTGGLGQAPDHFRASLTAVMKAVVVSTGVACSPVGMRQGKKVQDWYEATLPGVVTIMSDPLCGGNAGMMAQIVGYDPPAGEAHVSASSTCMVSLYKYMFHART